MKSLENKELSEIAGKYAAIYDDFAIKTYNDEDYWLYRRTAELLRVFSSKIKEFEDGKALQSPSGVQSRCSPDQSKEP